MGTRCGSLALLLICAVAEAAPDSLSDFKKEMRRVTKEEAAYWREYNNRFVRAAEGWYAPIKSQTRNKFMENDGDPGLIRRLYEDFASIEEARGNAYVELAQAGHPRAARKLVEELLETAKAIDRAERDLRPANNRVYAGLFDQRPGIRRHGLAFRRRLLVKALGLVPASEDTLGAKFFRRAAKQDSKHESTTAQVALFDVWGNRREDFVRPLIESRLEARKRSLRIAALQALIRFGPASRPVLIPLLKDESPVVQRALLHAVRHNGATDPNWIGPVLDYYTKASGLPRAEALATLETLSGGSFGDAPVKWSEWYKANRDELERGNPAPPRAKDKKGMKGTSFYRVGTPSERILFALDGAWSLIVPAEIEVQRTRHWMHWSRSDWKGLHEAHRSVFVRELGSATSRLPTRAGFQILMVGHHSNKEDVVGLWAEKGLAEPTERNRKKAVQFVERYKHSWINYDVHLALVTALETCEVDTIFLVNTGQIKACRYLLPEAIVADFRRRNRFHRFVVHTVRICDTGPESEALMKGLAKASGGTYTWAKQPPPRRP